MRERFGVVVDAVKRQTVYRVALFALVAVVTSAAIVLASRITDPGTSAPAKVDPTVDTSSASPPSATPTPQPRGPRQAPSEWQLRTRSSPELAARYPLADLYTADEIAYFKEIAFGIDMSANSSLDSDLVQTVLERGASSGDGILKWGDGEIGYYVARNPTMSDLAEVGVHHFQAGLTDSDAALSGAGVIGSGSGRVDVYRLPTRE